METDKKKLEKQIKRKLFLLSKFKIPMLGFTGIKLLEINDTTAITHIKLKRRTKNHLNSMYFAALAAGADVAAGIHAFYFANVHQKKVSFAFKGMSCEFIKRAESDCTFVSKDGKKVEDAILKSIETGDRVNETTHVDVFDAEKELVATFKMIVSVKCK